VRITQEWRCCDLFIPQYRQTASSARAADPQMRINQMRIKRVAEKTNFPDSLKFTNLDMLNSFKPRIPKNSVYLTKYRKRGNLKKTLAEYQAIPDSIRL
jgi:hypothetical protein